MHINKLTIADKVVVNNSGHRKVFDRFTILSDFKVFLKIFIAAFKTPNIFKLTN